MKETIGFSSKSLCDHRTCGHKKRLSSGSTSKSELKEAQQGEDNGDGNIEPSHAYRQHDDNNVMTENKVWEGLHKKDEDLDKDKADTSEGTASDATKGDDEELAPLVVDVEPEPVKCQVEEQFALLQVVLKDLGLPPTIDRSDAPKSVPKDSVSIVIMAELEECLNSFFEGNRQYQGSVLFVMTSSWLTREPSPDNSGRDVLYCHKAVTADSAGQTYVDVFIPSRKVTYIMNHLLGTSTSFRRTEGEPVTEFGIDTPMSSSMVLNSRIDDKLLTRAYCALVGVHHPVTLGFWMPGKTSWDYPEGLPTIKVVHLISRNVDSSFIAPYVIDFLNSPAMEQFPQVVVKPFGPTWNTCKGVTFHQKSDINAIVDAVLVLMCRVDPGTGILVESYLETFPPSVPLKVGRHGINVEDTKLAFRIRVIVSRTPDNKARTTQVVCGIADARTPIGGLITIPVSLNLTLTLWGVSDPEQQDSISEFLCTGAEKLLLKIIEEEVDLSAEERGGYGAQTELIGIDYILTKKNEVITPAVIEVNAHDCLYQVSCYEFINPEHKGEATRVLCQTMVARSQQYIMNGKLIVVVGAGGFSKRNLWKDAQEYGVKLVLIDANPEHSAKNQVHIFLHIDISDHTRDHDNSNAILHRLRAENIQPDGCITFWEDCVPLASLVAEGLGLEYTPSYEAALAAKTKGLTIAKLTSDLSEPPHLVPPALYSCPGIRVSTSEELEDAIRRVGLPGVLKLEHGSSAVGVLHAASVSEAVQHLRYVQTTLQSEDDHPGVGLGHGRSLIYMKCLQGSEHDVDIVMFEGQIIAAFISDNGPTRKPLCSETTAAMPSVLAQEQQRQLVAAAAACCRGLGLTTGVFNIEMMMTPLGARLLEINGRMGGFYLREWILAVYGVDMLHMALMACCGIRPVATNSIVQGYDSDMARKHRGQYLGIMLYPSRHKEALLTTATAKELQRMHDRGSVIFIQLEEKVHESQTIFEEPFCSLGVCAPTLDKAHAKLISVCQVLGLEMEESMNELLQDFVFYYWDKQ